MFVSRFNKKRSIFVIFLMSISIFFNLSSCSDTDDELQEPLEELRIGAVYISCESAPWQFSFDGLLACQQEELAILELNPENACPMLDIQTSDGNIVVSFSNNLEMGRIIVTINSELSMQDEDGNEVNELYVNDNDIWYLSQNDIRLKLSIVNVYIGGCFHELIRWEELNS